MPTENYYEGVRDVVDISTDIGTSCKLCEGKMVRIGYDVGIAESISHYIQEHGYKLLHVGPQTSHDDAGKPWHSTVPVLGK